MQVESLRIANACTEVKITNILDTLIEIKKDIKELDSKFAGKLVEKIVYGVGGAFGLALIAAVCVLVFPKTASAAALFIINLTN